MSNSSHKNHHTNITKNFEFQVPKIVSKVIISKSRIGKKEESVKSVLFIDKNYLESSPLFRQKVPVKISTKNKQITFLNTLNIKPIYKQRNKKISSVKVMLAGVFAVGAMFQSSSVTNVAEAKKPNRKTVNKHAKKEVIKIAFRPGSEELKNPLNRSGGRGRGNQTHRGLSVINNNGNVPSGRIIMPAIGEFSSGFGPRWGRFHAGIDIAAAVGTPINAAMSGKVSFTGWHGGYGQVVEINHPNGLVTRYAHCSKINVKEGQSISAGDNIANMGMTGHVTGPHVHFEVLVDGIQINPKNYM